MTRLFLALLLASAPVHAVTPATASPPEELVLLHINDVHGYALPREYLGTDLPAAYLHRRNGALFAAATFVRRMRTRAFLDHPELEAQFRDTGDDGILFLEAGDSWSGTLDDAATRGQNVVDLLRSSYLDVDASCVGNHAWDFGQKRWEELARRLGEHHPVLCANLTRGGKPLPFLKPWVILPVRGVRVGVIGLLTPSAVAESLPDNSRGLDVADPIAAVKKALDEMRALPEGERPDLTVLLAHVAFDRAFGKPKTAGFTLLAAMDDDRPGDDGHPEYNVDLVIDGHSHLDLEEKVDANTWLVQADHYALKLGEVRIPWDAARRRMAGPPAMKRHLLFEPEIPADVDFLAAETARVEKGKAKNDEGLVAAEPDLALPCVPRADPGRLDSPAGNVLMRALLDVNNARSPKKADVALINQSGVREGLYASREGVITAGTVHAVCPFANAVEACEVEARDLVMLLARQGVQQFTRMSWAGLEVGVLQEGKGPGAPTHRKLTAVWLAAADGARVNLMEPAEAARRVRVVAPSFLMSHQLADITLPNTRRKLGTTDNVMLKDFLKMLEKKDGRVTAAALAKLIGEPTRLVVE